MTVYQVGNNVPSRRRSNGVAEVRTEFSRMGIASFVLSLVSVALLQLFLPLVMLLSSYLAPAGVREAAGDVGVMWLLMTTLVELVALILVFRQQ